MLSIGNKKSPWTDAWRGGEQSKYHISELGNLNLTLANEVPVLEISIYCINCPNESNSIKGIVIPRFSRSNISLSFSSPSAGVAGIDLKRISRVSSTIQKHEEDLVNIHHLR